MKKKLFVALMLLVLVVVPVAAQSEPPERPLRSTPVNAANIEMLDTFTGNDGFVTIYRIGGRFIAAITQFENGVASFWSEQQETIINIADFDAAGCGHKVQVVVVDVHGSYEVLMFDIPFEVVCR